MTNEAMDFVRHILSRVGLYDSEEGCSLQTAVSSGATQKVAEMLADKSVERDWEERVDNLTLLHSACMGGHTAIVRMLLDAGAPLDPRVDLTQITPLMIAASEGHADVVELLLSRGANPHLLDCLGRSALCICTADEEKVLERIASDPGLHIDTANYRACKALLEDAVSRIKPLESISKKDGCAQCGGWPVGKGKLRKCSECRLVHYCSGECQKKDWKQHRLRCKQALDLRKAVETIGDRTKLLVECKAAMLALKLNRPLAIKMKLLKPLLAEFDLNTSSGEATETNTAPSAEDMMHLDACLDTICTLLREGPPDNSLDRPIIDREAALQFVDEQGLRRMLYYILRKEPMSEDHVDCLALFASGLFNSVHKADRDTASLITRRLIERGDGPHLIPLLKPLVQSSDESLQVMVQSSKILLRVCREEAALMLLKRKSASRRQRASSSGSVSTSGSGGAEGLQVPAGDERPVGSAAGAPGGNGAEGGEEVAGPLASLMFDKIDLGPMARAMQSGGNYHTGPLRFFVGLARTSKANCRRLLADPNCGLFVSSIFIHALSCEGELVVSMAAAFVARAMESMRDYTARVLTGVVSTWPMESGGRRTFTLSSLIYYSLKLCDPHATPQSTVVAADDCDCPIDNWKNGARIVAELAEKCVPLRPCWGVCAPIIQQILKTSNSNRVKKSLKLVKHKLTSGLMGPQLPGMYSI